jgi:signal transduction histidine kinase
MTSDPPQGTETKTAFLRSISHEVKTPLAAIAGFAYLLKERGADMSRDQLLAIVDSITMSAAKLDRMFSDFADLDRLARGQVTLELTPVDLLAVAQQVCDGTDRKTHPIEVGGEPTQIEADRLQIERIVQNLVLNAIRHTPPKTSIEVTVVPHDGGGLISVDDSGAGVPRDMRVAIFEPFRQGTSSAPGSGVGLFLVSKLAELHGGSAWVEDSASGGASFKVALP